MKTDKELIESLGGPAKIAALMGLAGRAGQIQRIHNWKSRGIPAKVRLNFPELFPLPTVNAQSQRSARSHPESNSTPTD